VEVKALRRNSIRRLDFDADFEIAANDVLVLLGTPEQLAWQKARILQG
jgi:CPA2 family monovalent cation:H+ antiporter-2